MTTGIIIPTTHAQAAARALSLVDKILPVPPGAAADAVPTPLQYRLSYGGKDPKAPQPGQSSWNHVWACDCSGFASWALGVSRKLDAYPHWGGYISTDSIWEAATKKSGWFEFVTTPQPGDLIVYPGHTDAHPIGHVGVVTSGGPSPLITDCHGQHHGDTTAVDTRGPKLWLASGGRYVRWLKAAP